MGTETEARLLGFEAPGKVEGSWGAESEEAPEKKDGGGDCRCARDQAALGYRKNEMPIQEKCRTEERRGHRGRDSEPPANPEPQDAPPETLQRSEDVWGEGVRGPIQIHDSRYLSPDATLP